MADDYSSSFTVHEVGSTTGEKFDGVFKVKTRMSFRDQLKVDELRRTILGQSPNGTQAYARAASAAEMFSELGVRILDAPSWWKNSNGGLDLYDDNVAIAVHDAAMKAESAAIKAITDKAEEAKKQLAQAVPAEG